MAILDTFTDADSAPLEDHIPEGAFTWTKHPAGDDAQIVGDSVVNVSNFLRAWYSANVNPVNDDGSWEATVEIEIGNPPVAAQVGVWLLADPVAFTGYELLINAFNSGGIKELVGLASHSDPATSVTAATPSGLLDPVTGTFPLTLRKTGSLIEGFWKGELVTSFTNSDYPTITALGIRYNANDAGFVKDYKITSLAGPTTPADFDADPSTAGSDTASADEIAANLRRTMLDRRLAGDASGVTVAFAGGNTTWTLPYEVAVDGSEGIVQVVRTGLEAPYLHRPFTVTRPAANQVRCVGDLSAEAVAIGIQYEFEYQFSTLFRRSQGGQTANQADTRGRLQLLRAVLQYRDSKMFDVHVTPLGRTERTYSFADDGHVDGEFRFPILCRNLDATIRITNDYPVGCRFYGLHWEGHFYNRSRSA